MFKQELSKQKGFTLIEMVVVIAVMGILMGLAFQGFATIQQNARDTHRISDLRTVQTQLELYFARCGHYPTAVVGCGTPAPSTAQGTLPWATLVSRLEGTVVGAGETPMPFVAGLPYVYHFGPNGLSYVIGATMERRGNNRDVTGSPLGLSCGTTAVPGTRFCLRS